jgi:hypothetical protein
MSKIQLPQESKLTDATAFETDPDKLVDEASGWALGLWRLVHQGMGDTQEASMHKAAKLARVSPNTIWKLRYRRPRDIAVSVYFKLKAAHARHVESVEGQIAANLEILRTLPANPSRTRLAASLEQYLRDQEGEEGGGDDFDPADDDQSKHWR